MKYDGLCGEIVTEILQQLVLLTLYMQWTQLVSDYHLQKIFLKATFLMRSAEVLFS